MPTKRPALAPTIKGFKLVAVSDGCGLYRKGEEFAISKGYGLNPRVKLGASGYPLPPSGRWRWLYEQGGVGPQIRRFVAGKLIAC